MRKEHLPAMTAMAFAAVFGLMTPDCTTAGTADSVAHQADKRHSINTAADSTLARLHTTASGSRELVGKARGVLVFPSVIAAGFSMGGQYGEEALRVGGGTSGYYSTTTASIGLQIGAQSKAIIFLFLTQEALDRLRNSEG